MRVEDFITKFRATVRDDARELGGAQDDKFWTDDEIVGYLNEAVQEACERAKLIEDRLTPQACTVQLQPGVSTYDLHHSVLEVKRLAMRGRPLDQSSVEELDHTYPGWEQRNGVPRHWIFEPANVQGAPKLRIVPTPAHADVLALTVYRGPLKPLDPCNPRGQPEIHDRFHLRLMDWMLHRAYLKQDADTFDPAKAATSLALFAQAFGERPDANVQRKQRDRRPPRVRFRW